MSNSRNIQETLEIAQRRGMQVLMQGLDQGPDGAPIKGVSMESISGPAIIQQELQFVSTSSIYTFSYANTAPAPTAELNNVRLGQNDIMSIYGIQIRYGIGANRNNRVYRSSGLTPDDNSLYTGLISVEYEATKPQFNMPTKTYLDEDTLIDPYAGFEFINPQRIITGYLANFNLIISLPDISGLVITADSYIQVALHGMVSRSSS